VCRGLGGNRVRRFVLAKYVIVVSALRLARDAWRLLGPAPERRGTGAGMTTGRLATVAGGSTDAASAADSLRRVRPVDSAAELLDVASEAAKTAGALLQARFEAGRESHVSAKSTPTDPVSDADLASSSPSGRCSRSAVRRTGCSRRRKAPTRPARAVCAGSSTRSTEPSISSTGCRSGVSASRSATSREPRRAIHAPMTAEFFSAVRGELPRRNGVELAWRATRRRSSASARRNRLAYASQVRAEQAELLTRLLPRVRDIRRFGVASLDLAGTAMGLYDAYYERGVHLWDIAVGALMCDGVGLAYVRSRGDHGGAGVPGRHALRDHRRQRSRHPRHQECARRTPSAVPPA